MATFGTFVSGQILTAAELNGAGEWQTYTPTWTQSATITKTVNWARYTQLNKLVIGSIKMTATSAGTANNKILVGLPVNASSSNFIIGTAILHDLSVTNFQFLPVSAFYESASTMSFSVMLGRTGNPFIDGQSDATKRAGENFVSGTSYAGITVASTDIIYVQFMYEAS